jgi:hypothetical protein
MRNLPMLLGLFIFIACKKIDKPPETPITPVVQEESIKFTTNLDTGAYNVSDTLPLTISVSSKLPSAGLIYSITTTWTDSSKQIFKLDSTLSQSSLTLNIIGHKKSGNYSLSVTISSKATPSNSSSKNISFVNNPQKRFNSNTIDIDIIYPEVSTEALTGLIYHFPAKVHIDENGQEYIIHNSTARLVGNTFEFLGPIQMKRESGQWKLDKIYKDIKIGNSRNIHIINNKSYLVSDATELPGGIGVPGQDYWVTMNNGTLTWTKINPDLRWSHDISGGDINNDGLMDAVCGSPLSIYIQNPDKTFTKRDDLYKWEQRISAFAVEVADLFGDSTPEIITGGYYGSGDPVQRNNIAVYSYNKQTNQFEIVFDNKNPDLFFTGDLGATSIEVHDFNGDGKKDIAVARESSFNSPPSRAIEIWKNDGNGSFSYLDKIQYAQEQLDFTEFICKDVNNDGALDIILNGNGGGDLFRVKNSQGAWEKSRLNHLIHLNDGKGKFGPFSGYNLDVSNVPNVPDYLYPFIRNNRLHFFGTHTKQNITNGIRVTYWDINVF